ncbi:hypothetical protein AAMO2058_000639800 [Amorphochlora amoebiformis]
MIRALISVFHPVYARAEAKHKRVPGGPHIIVAIDGTPISGSLVKWGAEHVFDKAGKITFVHATECSGPIEFEATSEEMDFQSGIVIRSYSEEIRRQAVHRGMGVLGKCNEISEEYGFAPDEQKLLLADKNSNVKYALLRYLDAAKPDLIICGSRGMGGFGRALLGSVADYLVHNSECAITIVKKRTGKD